ncbi:MAG: ComEC/Rec2 family competence protein [Candidatus Campbellbacteria bacterium]|nr:ComEC/Rec2 family competence protein [Candidatus Campbellbacteria bacterium]
MLKFRFFILPISLFGVASGLFLFEFLGLGEYFILFLLLIIFSVVFIAFAFRAERNLKVLIVFSSLFFLSVIFGLIRANLSEKEFILSRHSGERIEVMGTVMNDPEDRGSYLFVILEADFIRTDKVCASVSERVLVRTDRFEPISYGDNLRVRGLIERPEPFVTDTDRVFAYDEFLEKDNIGAVISFASVDVISSGDGNLIKQMLFSLKNEYLDTVSRYVPDPESSLLGGLTVGAKQSLGEELEKDFRSTGIIHIVVLSGYNVVIIAEAIFILLRYFSTRVRVSLGIIAVSFFAVLVGGGATVVRASIMAIAALVGRALGREVLAIQTLFFAAIAMLIFNPSLLLYDPSFQLSFMATLGLILLSKPLEKYLHWVRYKWLRDITTATVATQLAVLPLLIYLVGEVSLVALPVNLLVLPSVPPAMLLGFLTGIFGSIPFISLVLGPVFGALSFFFLSYELLVIEVFAALPFASLRLPHFPFVFVLSLYALLGFFTLVVSRPGAVRKNILLDVSHLFLGKREK